jgi:hypothetical protein
MARWTRIDVVGPRRAGDIGDSDCELLEQFKREFLPLFSTRNEEYRVSCMPHQVSVGKPVLKVDALIPVPEPKDKAAPASKQ